MTMKDKKCVFTTAQRGRIEQKIITKKKEKKKARSGTRLGVRCHRGLAPPPITSFRSFHMSHITTLSLINHLSEPAASTPIETMQTATEPIRPRLCKGHCTLGLRNWVGRCDSDGSGNVDRAGDREVGEVGSCRWCGLLNLPGEV